MTMPQGASGIADGAWMNDWVIRPDFATAGTAGAGTGGTGGTGSTGGTGGTGASGASGPPKGMFGDGYYTGGLASLDKRNRENIEDFYTDALPLLQAWQGAGDSLFNFLMSGFESVQDFLSAIVNFILGTDIDFGFLNDEIAEIFGALGDAVSPIVKFFIWVWDWFDENILKGIFDFLGWLWETFGDAIESILKPVFEFLGWLWDTVGSKVETFLKPAINLIDFLWDKFEDIVEDIAEPIVDFIVWGFQSFGDAVESVLKPVAEFIVWAWGELGEWAEDVANFIGWVWTNFSEGVESFMKPVIEFADHAWGEIGEWAEDVVDFFKWLWQNFGTAVDSFFKPAIEWVENAWNTLGSTVFDNITTFFSNITESIDGLNILEEAVNFFKLVVENFGSLVEGIPTAGDLLATISSFLGNVIVPTVTEGLQMLASWLTEIPVIGSIIASIIPVGWTNNNGQGPTNLADLAEYAAGLLTDKSVLPAMNLQGQVPADLLPIVTPGMVGTKSINFVADAGFAAATQLQSGSGWGWDQYESHTSDGGSARVYGDGGVKQLFSNLVAVSPGQEVYVEVYFKSTKSVGFTPTVAVGLRGYEDDEVAFTQSLGSQTLSSGATSVGWTKLSGSYKIPTSGMFTDVQHVRLALIVTSAPTGTTVWFDNAVMNKVQLIGQAFVEGAEPGSNLADDIENSIGSYEWGLLVDRIAKKTGATIDDVQDTIDNFLTGNSNLNANKIQSGNISSAFVSELKDTWNIIYKGAGNTSSLPPQAGVIGSALTALQSSAQAVGGHGADIIRLNGEINDLKNKVAALLAGQTPPTIITAKDEFNRLGSLGSDWVTEFYGGGSVSCDGANAVLNTGVNSNQFLSAVYNKSGTKTSASQYQRVYVSIADKPGVPLGTGGPGFNDLLLRTTSNKVCVVARFFANRTVKLFYRNGSWENNIYDPSTTFGTITLPYEPTAGTTLEAFAGSKSGSDQTKFYVKSGGWESSQFSISPTILAGLGSGWGFGIGNGIGIPALGAKVNYWGANDQA